MKKNLLLFSLAVLLAVFTYFFQEVGDLDKKRAKEEEGRVLNPEELGVLKGFTLAEVDLSKQGQQYLMTHTGQLADERKIESFMQKLAAIKIKRKLSPEELLTLDRDSVFPMKDEIMTFVFSRQKVSFQLGRKLDFDRSFYMEVIQGEKKDVVIAFDSSDINAVYQKGAAHRSKHHYDRFRELFYLKKSFFLDYRIFRTWMVDSWSLKNVHLNNTRNKAFLIDFINATSLPKVPETLRLKKKAVLDFEKKVALLEGKGFGDSNPKLYSEIPTAVMKIESSKGVAKVSLVELKKEPKKYFILSSLDNFYYEVSQEQAKVFLGHVQDFWDLRLLEKRPNLLSLNFNGVEKSVEIVSEKGRYKVKSSTSNPRHLMFKNLTDLLSSPGRHWVSGPELEENYIKQFELDWGLGPFFLMIRSGELLVYDKRRSEGLVYTFSGKPPVGLVLGDYFL